MESFGKFNRICIRNIIRFFCYSRNPTISKQLIKKERQVSVSCQYIYNINYKYTKKQINKEIIINELRSDSAFENDHHSLTF
jgi:hypothetical protein